MIIDFEQVILKFTYCVFLTIPLKMFHSVGVIPMLFIHFGGGVVGILFPIRIS